MTSQTKIEAFKDHIKVELRNVGIHPDGHPEYSTDLSGGQVATPSLYLADVSDAAIIEAKRIIGSNDWKLLGKIDPSLARESETPVSREVSIAINQVIGAELVARRESFQFFSKDGSGNVLTHAAVKGGLYGKLLIVDQHAEKAFPGIQEECRGRGRQT